MKRAILSLMVIVLALFSAVSASAASSSSLGTYVGLMTADRTIVSRTAVMIGVGGDLKASPSSLYEVRGGDIVRDEYYLLANRNDYTVINLKVGQFIESIEAYDSAHEKYLFGWFDELNGEKIFTIYLPPKTSVKLTLIYRVPSDRLGEIRFQSTVYDGGETNAKG